MGTNPPLSRQEVTAPTGSPDDVEAPGVPHGFPGNQKDDDPQAIDDYFEAADSGPQEYMGVIPTVNELPNATRLALSSLSFPAGTEIASMLCPADLKRKTIALSGYRNDTGAVVAFLVSDQQFSVPGIDGTYPTIFPPRANYYLWYSNLSFAFPSFDGYTGPLWVLPFLAAGQSATIQAIAVTE